MKIEGKGEEHNYPHNGMQKAALHCDTIPVDGRKMPPVCDN
jgi:hypothetical protein